MTHCPYCHEPAVFHGNSKHIYHGRDFGPVWSCGPCQAWVGCHPNLKPMGRLANAGLRKKRIAAHAIFDPIWQEDKRINNLTQGQARRKAYKWLGSQMGLVKDRCHISLMTPEETERVILICQTAKLEAWCRKSKGSSVWLMC